MPSSFIGKSPLKGSTHVRRQGPLLAVLYSDRKVVTFLTTMSTPGFEGNTNSRGVNKTVPSVVSLYNRTMGGVDLGDQLISNYDPQARSVKLWKKVLLNLHLTAAVNAYQILVATHGRTTFRLNFQHVIVRSLVGTYKGVKRPGRPLSDISQRVIHTLTTLEGKKRKQCLSCKDKQKHQVGCKGKVRTWCPTCGKGYEKLTIF